MQKPEQWITILSHENERKCTDLHFDFWVGNKDLFSLLFVIVRCEHSLLSPRWLNVHCC